MTATEYYVRTAYVPQKCDYLTAGVVYRFEPLNQANLTVGQIIDDEGYELDINVEACPHLQYAPWQLIEEPNND